MPSPRRPRHAFTLVEMVVVFVVLSVLAALTVPTFGSLTEAARIEATRLAAEAAAGDANALVLFDRRLDAAAGFAEGLWATIDGEMDASVELAGDPFGAVLRKWFGSRVYRCDIDVVDDYAVVDPATCRADDDAVPPPTTPPPEAVTSVPGQPTNLVVTPSPRRLLVTWDPPLSDGGLPVVDYVIEYSDDAVVWVTVDDGISTDTASTIDLADSGSYLVRVSAVNPIGAGDPVLTASAVAAECPVDVGDQGASGCVVGLDYTTQSTVVAAGVDTASDVTRIGSSLYYVHSTTDRLMRVGVDGSTPVELSTVTYPGAVALTSDGTWIYAASSSLRQVFQVNPDTGAVTVLAGSGTSGAVDGIGAEASFFSPGRGITTDGVYLYLTDGHAVRRVTIATGEVFTLAGVVNATGNVDAVGDAARFSNPADVTQVGGYLYVVDGHFYFRVRRIDLATREVTSITAAYAVLDPTALTTDGTYLYVLGETSLWRVGLDGAVDRRILDDTTITNTNTDSVITDGGYFYFRIGDTLREVDPLTAEPIGAPSGAPDTGIAQATAGLDYTTQSTVVAAGVDTASDVTRIGSSLYYVHSTTDRLMRVGVDGSTPVELSTVTYPGAVALTSDGTWIYAASSSLRQVFQVNPDTGARTLMAGHQLSEAGTADGVRAAASFFSPGRGMTTDGIHLYLTDGHAVRRVTIATGEVFTLAGVVRDATGNVDAVGDAARFSNPADVTQLGGYLYVVDGHFHHRVRRIDLATREVTSITDAFALNYEPLSLTTDGTYLYVLGETSLWRVGLDGAVTVVAGSSDIDQATGDSVVFGADSSLYYRLGDTVRNLR